MFVIRMQTLKLMVKTYLILLRVKKSLLERTYSVATASPPPATRNTCRTCVSAIGLPVSQSTGSSIARGERDVAR